MITRLSGPEFLVCYALIIVLVAVACRWLRERGDASRSLPALQVTGQVDPYEIACLRGDENELTRVVIAHLVDRGYLQVTTRSMGFWRGSELCIAHRDQPPALDRLTPLERCVFDWFQGERKADEVFGQTGLPLFVKPHAYRLEERLHTERLLTGDDAKTRTTLIRMVAIPVVVWVGLWRCMTGLTNGRPVRFVVIMGLVGLFMLMAASVRGRLSYRGRTYLQAVQRRWEALKSAPVPGGIGLAVALFGMAVLSGTAHGALADAFKRAQSNGGGGGFDACGDGCGGCGGCSGCNA